MIYSVVKTRIGAFVDGDLSENPQPLSFDKNRVSSAQNSTILWTEKTVKKFFNDGQDLQKISEVLILNKSDWFSRHRAKL